MPSLKPLKNSCSIHARCSKSSLKHSIRFCGIFPSLKHNFIAYCSSKVSSRSDCIFEIHQLWQSAFSRVYSNCCCSCSFEPEIIKIGLSSYKMYNNNILNFQESTTILNAHAKKVWKFIIFTSYLYFSSIRMTLAWNKSMKVDIPLKQRNHTKHFDWWKLSLAPKVHILINN